METTTTSKGTFHRWGRWPNISEIFFGDEQQVRILLTPLERDAADLLWRQRDRRLRPEESGDEWITPGSQLEPLLWRFSREESAQASRETSEPSEGERQPESSSEDEDEKFLEEVAKRQAEQETDIGEMDNEIDTEHERMQEREVVGQIAQYKKMNPLIRHRMINRAQLLATKEAEQEERTKKLERLEELRLNFQEAGISIEQCVPETLQDSVLLLLALPRSFRICRQSIFCPEEDCPSKKPIKTLEVLAIHLQRDHGVSKQETEYMV
jgi:uncharacterized protein YaaR (DUF327 family)